MTIWRRIRLFSIGIGLGLLIVYFYFGDRELNTWTPQSRVIAAIDSAEVSITPRANCQLKCLGITKDQAEEFALASKVNFSESNPKHEPCPIYRLKTKDEAQAFEMLWEVCEKKNTAELMSISKEGVDCDCP